MVGIAGDKAAARCRALPLGVPSDVLERLPKVVGRAIGAERGFGHPELRPFVADMKRWSHSHAKRLCATVGAGELGPGPASVISSAAIQWAASRMLFDKGEWKLASQLANDSRQNLLAAHEMCAREAKSKAQGRKNRAPLDLAKALEVGGEAVPGPTNRRAGTEHAKGGAGAPRVKVDPPPAPGSAPPGGLVPGGPQAAPGSPAASPAPGPESAPATEEDPS